VLLSNGAPRHEVVLGEWKYSATHSLTSAVNGGNGQLPVWCLVKHRMPLYGLTLEAIKGHSLLN